jgi:hypothetical protein
MSNATYVHLKGDIAECVAFNYIQEVLVPRLRPKHDVLLHRSLNHYNRYATLSSVDGHCVISPNEISRVEDGSFFPPHHGTTSGKVPSAVSNSMVSPLGPWPSSDTIYRIESETIFEKCVRTLEKGGYRPDFLLVGCAKGLEEKVETKDLNGIFEPRVTEIRPQKVYLLEVKSSNPKVSRSYTAGQKRTLRELVHSESVEVLLIHVPVNLDRNFHVSIHLSSDLEKKSNFLGKKEHDQGHAMNGSGLGSTSMI